MSSSVRALGQFGVALVLFLLFLPKAQWSLRPIDWAGLVFLGLGSTLVGHGLWVRVTTRLRPATTSILYYASVPIALALSVLVLSEPLTPRIAVGAALIVGGSLLGLMAQARAARELRIEIGIAVSLIGSRREMTRTRIAGLLVIADFARLARSATSVALSNSTFFSFST